MAVKIERERARVRARETDRQTDRLHNRKRTSESMSATAALPTTTTPRQICSRHNSWHLLLTSCRTASLLLTTYSRATTATNQWHTMQQCTSYQSIISGIFNITNKTRSDMTDRSSNLQTANSLQQHQRWPRSNTLLLSTSVVFIATTTYSFCITYFSWSQAGFKVPSPTQCYSCCPTHKD